MRQGIRWFFMDGVLMIRMLDACMVLSMSIVELGLVGLSMVSAALPLRLEKAKGILVGNELCSTNSML
jgi:hypothetical protein